MDAENIKINLNNATYEETKEIPIFIEKEILKKNSQILHFTLQYFVGLLGI